VWHSGLLPALETLLWPHAHDPAFIRAANDAVESVAAQVGLATGVAAPRLRGARVRPRSLRELAGFAARFDAALKANPAVQLGVSAPELRRYAPARSSARAAGATALSNPLHRIVRRLNTGHGHGLYTTVVEELLIAAGAGAEATRIWDGFKRDIDDSFAPQAQAGGTAFLRNLVKTAAGVPRLRLTLIGHSAGAIYVQRLIGALYAHFPVPQSLQPEVVLIAAALSCEEMAAGMAAPGSPVRAFRQFALTDAAERGYWEVEFLYNRSILYLVSALCEGDPDADRPLVGMQRYWSGAPPFTTPQVRAVTGFVGPGRSVWSPTPPTAPPGFRAGATRHEGFPEDPATLASVCRILSGGL
jgi:hypothetical protein